MKEQEKNTDRILSMSPNTSPVAKGLADLAPPAKGISDLRLNAPPSIKEVEDIRKILSDSLKPPSIDDTIASIVNRTNKFYNQ